VRADYWPLKRPIYILCRERSSLCIITYCGMRTDLRLILSSASQTTCATRNHISLSPVCCMYSLTSTFLHRPVIDHGSLCCSYVGCTHSVSIGKYKPFTIVYILLQCTCYGFDGRKEQRFLSVLNTVAMMGLSVGTLHAVPPVLYARLMASRCRLYMERTSSDSEKVDEGHAHALPQDGHVVPGGNGLQSWLSRRDNDPGTKGGPGSSSRD